MRQKKPFCLLPFFNLEYEHSPRQAPDKLVSKTGHEGSDSFLLISGDGEQDGDPGGRQAVREGERIAQHQLLAVGVVVGVGRTCWT